MNERKATGTVSSRLHASHTSARVQKRSLLAPGTERPPFADLGIARGERVICDLGKLTAGRLFVLANSGGGKTRLLRRLLEQSWGLIQHIVIDPDGQLATLGEVFDYLVLDAEKIFSVSAADLALSLRERRYSVVLDLSEADANDKQMFVGDFLTALIGCPRETWRSTMVVIDEAQVLASVGSTSAEVDDDLRKACVNAIADLNGRGRKRGLALVVSSLRIATLAKGALSGIQNFLVGGCSLDIDASRAASLLGLERSKKSIVQTLPIGQFIAFGPAFSPAPTRFKVGDVKSRHPGTPPVDKPPALSVDDAHGVFESIPRKPERATVSEVAEYLFDRNRCDGLLLDRLRNGKFEVDPRVVLDRANALRKEEGKTAFAFSDIGRLDTTAKGTVKIAARWMYKAPSEVARTPRGPREACSRERSESGERTTTDACTQGKIVAQRAESRVPNVAKADGDSHLRASSLSPGALAKGGGATLHPIPAEPVPGPPREGGDRGAGFSPSAPPANSFAVGSAKSGGDAHVRPSSKATLERRLRALPSTLTIVEVSAMLKVDVDDAQRMANACGLRFAESTLPIKVDMPAVVGFLESIGFEIIPTTRGGFLVNGKFSYDGPHLVALANRERESRQLVAFAVSGSGPVQRGSTAQGPRQRVRPETGPRTGSDRSR